MHDLLSAIVACARTTTVWRRAAVPLDELAARGPHRAPRGRLFHERLSRPEHVNVIAECKRRSPARGVLSGDYHPAAIALGYARAGAAAISVLTEPAFFDGDLSHLAAVRDAVDVPLLRKDFIVDDYQVHEARAAGADAVLLIVAAVSQPALVSLLATADRLGLAALVEVHSRTELDRAVDAGAAVIGVNSRDLRTLRVETTVFEQLLPHVPAGCIAVAESGIASADEVARLHSAGYRGFLIGEWFMTSADPGGRLRDLLGGRA